jgi:hypothetical protein
VLLLIDLLIPNDDNEPVNIKKCTHTYGITITWYWSRSPVLYVGSNWVFHTELVIGTTKTESKTDLGLMHNKSDRTREVDTTQTESKLSNC